MLRWFLACRLSAATLFVEEIVALASQALAWRALPYRHDTLAVDCVRSW